jgi:peroxiredoxin
MLSGMFVLAASTIIFSQTVKPLTPTEVKPDAPAFSVTSLDGKKFELATLRGKVVVLNFWFTGCPPCMEEIPKLNGLVDEFKNKDVIFIAPTWDNEATLRAFVKEHPFKYHVVPNAGDMIIDSYGDGTGNVAFPRHLVINKEGRIDTEVMGTLVTKEGAQKFDDLRKTITRLLSVPAGNGR